MIYGYRGDPIYEIIIREYDRDLHRYDDFFIPNYMTTTLRIKLMHY